MLSDREKKEMLIDAGSSRRRGSFDHSRSMKYAVSIDDYISFLDDVQKIFSPFKISTYRTITKLNKL